MKQTEVTQLYQNLLSHISTVMQGQENAIRKLLAAFATGGHILLEDLPGTGKTTLAKALSQSLDASFHRIQFTPDLLPSDILGVSIFDQREQNFKFHQGPVFTEILLADEINRASPRTQSALLEAMAERQVSIDGQSYALHDTFFVIATQNPVEFHGTYPLPEAQMDRFAMSFSLGYVSHEEEVNILSRQQGQVTDQFNLQACISRTEIQQLRQQVLQIRISTELKHYIVELIRATRIATGVELGASPRAALAIMKLAQALALFDGLEYVTPDQIQEIATPVIAHRLKIDSQARFSGRNAEDIVQEILQQVAVPV
ncbi:AAA family ATPase [Candidatus Venteria ishoeyi]|uniref:Holliday junction DNA helicase RuvB n=1 Tax=Candidatus Venteria ishoeyi TaxID=1899563 RepID=A0A1H6FCH9_9GAMM|nr:MoxR family ATPase [Candidatus Venteria ishoeyi]MDM8546528.1 MoxR family ATPase [Candidatus Venteria ishoeyi]SEH07101.1 Holliday junction DNA helicase RuvB [Candidatus Venteria ishoeyi]